MNTQSKSQAETLWDQADTLITEAFQAFTDLKETK